MDEIMYAFAVEYDRSQDCLAKFIEQYPTCEADLRDIAAMIDNPPEPIPHHVMIDDTGADAAWKRFVEAWRKA